MPTSKTAKKLAMPWWAGEEVVALGAVPNLLPQKLDGRRHTVQSVYNWTTVGLRGVRLRRFKAAGSYATTREELARWQAAITEIAEAEAAGV